MIRRHFTKASALVVTAALLALLLSHIELGDLLATLKSIEPGYVLLGFGAYASCYLFRALRFYVLLNKEVGVADLFTIVCVHNMVSSIMPARTGELSYIYLLKKYHKKSTADGAATLILARMMDFMTISLIFFASAMLVDELPGMMSDIMDLVALSSLTVFVLFVTMIFGGGTSIETIQRVANRLDLNEKSLITTSMDKCRVFESRANAVGSKGIFVLAFTFSILIWTSQYLMYYVLLRGFDLDLSIVLIILGATFATFASIIPVPSVGSLGVYEGLWAISFMAIGIPKETAISVGLGVHLTFMMYFILLGLAAICKIGYKPQRLYEP